MYPRFFLIFFFSWMSTIHAQTVPIGQWREHFPYRQGIALAAGGGQIYCATPYSLLAISVDDHAITRYSKVNGLHDAGIAAIGFHESTGALVIAYTNSNVDILQQENIINIPDIKLSGDKHIRHIAFYGYSAYLSTAIGIIVIDLQKQEITDTYTLGLVNAVAADGQYLYAATSNGVKRAPLQGVNLADPANWQNASAGLRSAPVVSLINKNGLQCLQQDTVYSWQNGQWQRIFANGNPIRNLTNDGFVIQSRNIIQGSQVLTTSSPNDALSVNGSVWIADAQQGLMQYDGTYHNFSPNSPNGIVTGEMAIVKGALWAASGSVTDNWLSTGNKSGLYKFDQDEWTNYTYPDSLADIITVAGAGDSVYAGSFGGGLIAVNGPVYKYSPPDLVSGLATDKNGNLWISAFGSINDLLVKKKDNSWQSFSIPIFHLSNAVSQILVDDVDQKWIVSPQGNGLFAFNHGADIAQTADDKWKLYKSGAGQGNLPSNDVFCIAKDLRGWIWIGTARGVAVVQCPLQMCDAYWPIVKQDDFAGYLFQNEQVNTIAVDGANQKWVGTQNGVWLVSPDGDKILQHFNTDNSPLSGNVVYRIIVHPTTGEVFFATAAGLLSWRGTATEGKQQQDNDVLVFPNPVQPGYEGTIAIRGLVQNAIVKITDVTGKLVYQTRAQGGQAVWSGRDYTGHRPQSGVYLVFSTDESGQEKIVSKLVFIR